LTSKKDLDIIIEKEEEQIAEKIFSELEPYFKGILALDVKSKELQLFKENYNYFVHKFAEKLEVFSNLLIFKDVPISDIRGQLTLLFGYLGTVESIGNAIVNFLVILLVANGIDFHIERKYRTPTIKHATLIRELEKDRVSLGTKLNFLRDNNIKTVPLIIDNELRNSIAHLNFTLKEKRIYIKGQDAILLVGNASRKLSFLIGLIFGSLLFDTKM